MSVRQTLRRLWCAIRGEEVCERFDPDEPTEQGAFARWMLAQKHASQRRQNFLERELMRGREQ